jgi:hypothetical protein
MHMRGPHVARIEKPPTMGANVLNRIQDRVPLLMPELKGSLQHQRLFGLMARFVQRQKPRPALVVFAVNRTVLVTMQMLTVTRKRNQVGGYRPTIATSLCAIRQALTE